MRQHFPAGGQNPIPLKNQVITNKKQMYEI